MLGKKIKMYLEEKGIKQSFLAEKTSIPQSTLSALLNDKRGILANEYFSICTALDVPVDTFTTNQPL